MPVRPGKRRGGRGAGTAPAPERRGRPPCSRQPQEGLTMPPRRYQFDNQLPVPRQDPSLPVYQPQPLPGPAAYDDGRQIIVQHIHQAPPDRTLQRVTLAAGAGGGAVVAGVFLGPMVVTVLASAALPLAFLALALVAAAWGVGTVVKAAGSEDAKAAAKNVARARKRR
ncbi:DUF6251 family protein [Streptomyces sp. NPDC101227]|uniref:DUF6251 family protein n=1 Tax=Streptomyces sp. NPDC101227 TaxID=3366136 RepID=UPI0037FDAB1C